MELQALREVTRELELLLFVDGARLSAAFVAAPECTPELFTELCDIFYVGGTKNGALAGDAVVIANDSLKKDFRRYMRQRGGVLAKGRFLGSQFSRLFADDNLWLSIGRQATDSAQYLASELAKLGIQFLSDSPTNQIFPLLSDTVCRKLEEEFGFYRWDTIREDGKVPVRFVC